MSFIPIRRIVLMASALAALTTVAAASEKAYNEYLTPGEFNVTSVIEPAPLLILAES